MLAQIDFEGPDGFLGTRASLMIDFVVVAMVGVLVVLWWSVAQVKQRRFYTHKWTQVILASVLLAAVVAFEIDMRLLSNWQERSANEIGGSPSQLVWNMLYFHLIFAVSSFVLWPMVVISALRKFPNPPAPGEHSGSHRFWARVAAVDMTITAVTGWTWYYVAFVR